LAQEPPGNLVNVRPAQLTRATRAGTGAPRLHTHPSRDREAAHVASRG